MGSNLEIASLHRQGEGRLHTMTLPYTFVKRGASGTGVHYLVVFSPFPLSIHPQVFSSFTPKYLVPLL